MAALLLSSIALGAAAPDDDRTDIGTVRATASGDASTSPPGSAPALAPSRPPLDAAQPTSVVGPAYIRNAVVPSANYDNIIKFLPSVQNIEPTGAGLQQDFQETIRGFRYTQFNSTFDGLVLPGTISNFAPQPGAYFMAHDIQSVSVDRGPGTASQIGYATFGGTVATTLTSPSSSFGVNPYFTTGSWGLRQEGIRLDTGAMPALNGARGLLDLQHLESNGYLTGTSTLRNNAYSKIEVPVDDNTIITFAGMYDYARTHTPYGATLAQIQRLGPTYALNGDPKSQAYTGYNVDNYFTDFDYVGIKSNLGEGWAIDDKIYTISYFHNGTQGADPNGTTPNLSGTIFLNGVPTRVVNDVPGQVNHSDFRTYGNVMRISKDTAYGQLRFGPWLDYDVGSSWRQNIDFSAGNQVYVTRAGATPFQTNYHTSLTTVQPYLEFALQPTPDLTITPGLKYTFVRRGLDAAILNSAKANAPSGQDFDQLQPAIDAHYKLATGWVAYAQVARGFLAPPLNTVLVDVSNAPTALKPQTTMNYQIGTTFQNDRFSAGFDMYFIQFDNYIASQRTPLGSKYTNNGDATFKGIEAEGTVKLIEGLALYANGTLNDATFDQTGFPVAVNPRSTAAAGPILTRDNAFATMLWKYVGPQYVQDGSGPQSHPLFPIRGYNNVDLAFGYTLLLPQFGGRSLNLRANVSNLFDNHNLAGLIGTTASGQALYAVNPGRGFFVSLSASL